MDVSRDAYGAFVVDEPFQRQPDAYGAFAVDEGPKLGDIQKKLLELRLDHAGPGDIQKKLFELRKPRKASGPLLPVEKSPFPGTEEFRLGGYRIIEEKDDYLICKGLDPNAIDPFGQHAPSVIRTIKVVKPSLLQRTPWDGKTVNLIVGGVPTNVTFEYTGIGVRIARATVDSEEAEEVQRITMDYIPGDTLIAVKIRKNDAVDGVDVYSARGGRLSWVDLNMSGRCWAVE
jgi:hypothetical protein